MRSDLLGICCVETRPRPRDLFSTLLLGSEILRLGWTKPPCRLTHRMRLGGWETRRVDEQVSGRRWVRVEVVAAAAAAAVSILDAAATVAIFGEDRWGEIGVDRVRKILDAMPADSMPARKIIFTSC